jgi:hypothetical protein
MVEEFSNVLPHRVVCKPFKGAPFLVHVHHVEAATVFTKGVLSEELMIHRRVQTLHGLQCE